MLIGIDVGGTFTDGVLFADGKIKATAKVPTDNAHLKESVLGVLDKILSGCDGNPPDRLVLSTTLVTNLLATGRGEATALILLPGYGLPAEALFSFPHTYRVKGAIDFRGREIEPLDEKELESVLEQIVSEGITRVAVAAKFANRNNRSELRIREFVKHRYPQLAVFISSEVSGKLNFLRRAVTTYFTAMTSPAWNHFVDEIEAALRERQLNVEVEVLKADGGTVSLEHSRRMPCETVFSGPAASTMGAVALHEDLLNAVVIDIGGTTSDISLLIEGEPLYASRGARIEGHYTHVAAFAVRSLPLGGDSSLACISGQLVVEEGRQGPAACLGGAVATVTDAFNYRYSLGIGEKEASLKALQELCSQCGLEPTELSTEVVNIVTGKLARAIEDMFREWENEPAYKIWEVINQRKFAPERLLGIGAAAPAIIPALSEHMQIPGEVHNYAPVANALGASVVRPTLAVSLHADTQIGAAVIDPGARRVELANPAKTQLEDMKTLARQELERIAAERGMQDYAADYRYYLEEQFNSLGGRSRAGKIFEVGIQISPGFIHEFKGVQS